MKKKMLCLITVIAISCQVFADGEFSLSGDGGIFKLNSTVDPIILGGGIAFAATDIVLSKVVKPNQVDYSNSLFFSKEEVNAFDRMFMNDYSKSLDYTSTGLEAISLLTPLCLLGTSKSEWFTIGTMYAETVIFAYSFKELGKLLLNRPRPFMYFDNPPANKIDDGDWNDSFFSGHSTLSFAAASFTSFVFCKYFPDSNWKIPVIALSYSLASATSVLRIAGGSHFVTDVLVGAAVGTATGLLIPFLHTLNSSENKNLSFTGCNSSFTATIIPTGVYFEIKL